MIRLLTLTLVASLLSVAACAAPLRLHGQAPTVVSTQNIRTTDGIFADVASLSTLADTEVTVTVVGGVDFCVPLYPCQTAADGPQTWNRRNLLDGYLSAQATSATAGSLARWTIQAAGQNAQRIDWTVADSFATNYTTLGKQTPALFGGYDLSRLPGLAANKTISVDASNCFGIANSRFLTWKSTGAAYSASSPPTKACTSPTLGTDAYTVTVADAGLGQTWNVVFTVNDNEWNFASGPTDTATVNQLIYILGRNLLCGDQVVGEQVSYLGNQAGLNASTPTTGRAGEACPTTPYVGADPNGTMAIGWGPNDTYAPGWVTIRGRYPAGTAWASQINSDNSSSNNRAVTSPRATPEMYLRFSNLNGAPEPRNTAGQADAYEWFMVDHSYINVGTSATTVAALMFQNNITKPGDRAAKLFALYNHTIGNGRTVAAAVVLSRESQVVGNLFESHAADVTKPGMWDEPVLGDCQNHSLMAFNLSTNKKNTRTDHPDFAQWDPLTLNSGIYNSPIYAALPADSTACMAPFIGNLALMGTPYLITQTDIDAGTAWQGQIPLQADLGKAIHGEQCFFMGNFNAVRADIYHREWYLGNMCADGTAHGLEVARTTADSIITNNLIMGDYGPTYAAQNGGLAGGQYTNGWFGLQTTALLGPPGINTICMASSVAYCTYPAGTKSYNNAFLAKDMTVTGGVVADNVAVVCATVSAPSCPYYLGFTPTEITDRFVNPYIGSGATNWRAVVEAYTPKVGSDLLQYVATKCKVVGPFGDLTMLDFGRQRWSLTKLSTNDAC